MKLGQVSYIDDIRSVWVNEAKDFTPWLAENLDTLGAELGMDIELITTEHGIGSFSLDIYAREVNTGHSVVIENQLEATDHSHLGQLITYASGADAKIIIWISREVREEHRKAIDWLNQVSNEDTHFFAVEIQAITIDGSLPAPLFKVKASPNEWGKAQKAIVSGGSGAKTPKQMYYHEFFTKFLAELKQRKPHFTNAKSVGYDSWFSFSSGKTGFSYTVTFRSGNRFSCEFYIDMNDKELNKAKFDELSQFNHEISSVLGDLSWERLDDKRACRIAAYMDASNEDSMIDWGIRTLIAFKDTFTKYL
ncbi:DUF4268 domain-containing protein [Paenibacillus harenae]|uniref:DUF4268 domain-containing protein n=1 Tax=Paenibacillus harenae TaxID=306543 RepID=UPI00278D0D1A|nr:DUF4268 domain-containing protein [Paenibacillus harenae]MDQ0059452.1 hypothetical protein [Paenibacillus harenae]